MEECPGFNNLFQIQFINIKKLTYWVAILLT